MDHAWVKVTKYK